ncbi:uncharacterized protein ACNLHF_001064 isoform 1-T2 [Anomaloglossus baeobatrachus]|uniref:uncharacterized protein LOC142250935 n=1 Tax=Anomaloglossus baeobatrachus TaxID=238106 RepID=UPI003F50158C
MSDLCRLCSSQLRGSRRKWLFGGSGSLPALFSHVVGTPVLRNPPGSSPRPGKEKGRPEDAEFICGKCCHSLNVYHRYDQVLSRMRELYEQRTSRLVKEKEKLSFTLRTIHAKAWGLPVPEYLGHHSDRNTYGYRGSYNDLRSPGYCKSRNNSLSPGYQNSCPTSPFPDRPGSFHGSLGSLSSATPSKSYQNLLDHDRSMWEHESWWDDHHRGCSHCIKGEKCHSCSSWRVSDANYESVCTVPRRKKHSRREDDVSGLLRSKSLGSVGGESTSSKGSLLSLSASSLDSLSYGGEEADGVVFWEAKSPLASSPPSSLSLPKPMVGEVLKSLKEIKYSPVKTPTRSKIPVRGQQRVDNVAIYVEEDYEKPRVEEPVPDYDAYMGVGPEICKTQTSRSLHIRETLTWLQTQLKSAQSGGTGAGQQDQMIEQQELIRDLIKRLKSKEEFLEDSLTLLLSLPLAGEPSGEIITDFVEKLRTREDQIQREGDELASIKRQREAELKRLQEELSAREEDIAGLSKVLRDNQDIITALRDLLGEKDFTIQRLEVALDSANRSAASQDALRLCALREKDALIAAIQAALSSSNQDVEALADSLLSQGLDDFSTSIPGFSTPNPLVSQIQEKGRLLSQAHAENQRQSVQHQRDIQDLLNALNESQTLLQEQLRHCKKRLQDGAKEQKTLREALRVKEGELQEDRRKNNADRHQVHAKVLQLQDSAREKDQTTKKLLQNAENRDQIIKKLQERLTLGGVMMGTL